MLSESQVTGTLFCELRVQVLIKGPYFLRLSKGGILEEVRVNMNHNKERKYLKSLRLLDCLQSATKTKVDKKKTVSYNDFVRKILNSK